MINSRVMSDPCNPHPIFWWKMKGSQCTSLQPHHAYARSVCFACWQKMWVGDKQPRQRSDCGRLRGGAELAVLAVGAVGVQLGSHVAKKECHWSTFTIVWLARKLSTPFLCCAQHLVESIPASSASSLLSGGPLPLGHLSCVNFLCSFYFWWGSRLQQN